MKIINGKISYEDYVLNKAIEEDSFMPDFKVKKDIYSIAGLIEEAKIYGRAICPVCKAEKEAQGIISYDKRNLQIEEDKHFGFCFRCHTVFSDNSDKDVIRLSDFSFKEPYKISTLNCNFLLKKHSVEKGINYVKQRNPFITDEFIQKHRLICENNRIIIPFFYGNDMIYYQIRFIEVLEGKPKYFNPIIDHKPVYCLNFNPSKDTIVVEGIFDAFALESVVDIKKYNIVAMIGCFVSDYQMFLFNQMGGLKKLIIFMDDINKSKDLAKRFFRKGFKGPIEIIKTYNDIDPEELLKLLGKDRFLSYVENYREIISFYKNNRTKFL